MTRIAASTAFTDVKPFPAAVGSVPGHNRPPVHVQAVGDFTAALDAHVLGNGTRLRDRMSELIAGADRATATDDETTGRCATMMRQITAVIGEVEDARKATKDPYFRAGQAIDAEAKAVKAPLESALAKVKGPHDAYMIAKAARESEERRAWEAEARRQRDEADRIQREAEQRAREEAARAAAENRPPEPVHIPEPVYVEPVAPVAEPTRIRSDFGQLSSVRTEWKSQIEDYTVAFIAVENNQKVREAIDKAIQALVKGGVHEIAGVRVYEAPVVQVRG